VCIYIYYIVSYKANALLTASATTDTAEEALIIINHQSRIYISYNLIYLGILVGIAAGTRYDNIMRYFNIILFVVAVATTVRTKDLHTVHGVCAFKTNDYIMDINFFYFGKSTLMQIL